MPINVWDKNIYPYPIFNGTTVEVWEWISNFISHLTIDVITYPPNNCAHASCFVGFCCSQIPPDLTHICGLTSLALEWSHDCSSANEDALKIWVNRSHECSDIIKIKQTPINMCAYFWIFWRYIGKKSIASQMMTWAFACLGKRRVWLRLFFCYKMHCLITVPWRPYRQTFAYH